MPFRKATKGPTKDNGYRQLKSKSTGKDGTGHGMGDRQKLCTPRSTTFTARSSTRPLSSLIRDGARTIIVHHRIHFLQGHPFDVIDLIRVGLHGNRTIHLSCINVRVDGLGREGNAPQVQAVVKQTFDA